ncbi:MAG TPA: nuclear transport factor 2 family protein [Pseudonocardia sp.]|nr:nuclear transport factor 2 family protein [Pseudonocardia sp.]
MNIAQLCAREEIRELIARYCVDADAGKLSEVAGLFTADGHIEFRDQKYVGPDGVLGMFTESGQRLRRSDLGDTALRGRLLHTVSTTSISLDGADSARVHSYFTVLSGIGVDHWGRYRDEVVCEDGRWRFAARRITVDGRTPGGVGEVLA